ncbi:hypothetical protein [Fibrobacter sp. UWH9]|uniref:hypothetical protein n=1 Tax=Fibrobacter sp. UWH9 TaxID=1896213 RepID=UPI00093500FB|nr:hypothetical protein [Fibrobacter sp. UWH9]
MNGTLVAIGKKMVVMLYFLSLFFAMIGISFMTLYSLMRTKIKNKFFVSFVSILYIPIFFFFANIPYVIEKRVGYGGGLGDYWRLSFLLWLCFDLFAKK